MADDIKIKIGLIGRVAETYRKVSSTIRGQTNRMQQSMDKLVGSSKKFATSLGGLATAVGGLLIFRKVNNLLKESLDLYDQQIMAERKLEQALGYTSEALLTQASELQKVTRFGDEATIEAQALIGMFVKEEDQIKKVIPLVQDLAAAKGMELSVAADLVSKTLGSSTNALSRYGLEVDGAVGSSERLTSLIGSMERAVKGQARAMAEVGSGALVQLQNRIGDIKELLGKAFLPLINKVAQRLEKLFTAGLKGNELEARFERLAAGVEKILENLDLILIAATGIMAALAPAKIGAIVTAFASLNPVIAGIAITAGIIFKNIADTREELRKMNDVTWMENKAKVEQIHNLRQLYDYHKENVKLLREANEKGWEPSFKRLTEINEQMKELVGYTFETGAGHVLTVGFLETQLSALERIKKKKDEIEGGGKKKSTGVPDWSTDETPSGGNAALEEMQDAHVKIWEAQQRLKTDAIQLQRELNDVLAIERLDGKKREIEELNQWFKERAAILESGNQSLRTLEAIHQERMEAIDEKYKQESLYREEQYWNDKFTAAQRGVNLLSGLLGDSKFTRILSGGIRIGKGIYTGDPFTSLEGGVDIINTLTAQSGGVFTGPKSGYPAVLHGQEAVIPLKNGAVPVRLEGQQMGQQTVINNYYYQNESQGVVSMTKAERLLKLSHDNREIAVYGIA